MSLLRRRPLSTSSQLPMFSRLTEEIDQFFNQDFPLLGRQRNLLSEVWQPTVDVEQQDNCYMVRADIPGVDVNDITVLLEGNNLIIEGKRDTHVEEHKLDYRQVERNYGSFYRCINLPEASEDVKKIKAHCSKGVLEVKVPTTGVASQKRIEVQVD